MNEWIAMAVIITTPPCIVSRLGCSLIISQTQIGPIIVSNKKNKFTSAAGMNLGSYGYQYKWYGNTHNTH